MRPSISSEIVAGRYTEADWSLDLNDGERENPIATEENPVTRDQRRQKMYARTGWEVQDWLRRLQKDKRRKMTAPEFREKFKSRYLYFSYGL